MLLYYTYAKSNKYMCVQCPGVQIHICICVFVYLCICAFVYLWQICGMVERRGERWRPIGGAANQLWSNQGPNCVSNQFGSQLPGNQEQSYNGEYHFHFKTPSLSANHRAAKMLLLKRFRVFETTNNKKCKPLFDRAIYDIVQWRMRTAV